LRRVPMRFQNGREEVGEERGCGSISSKGGGNGWGRI
jgi:hypothetical protein